MVRSRLYPAVALLLAGCGAGVPIQLRLDEIDVDLSIDSSITAVEAQLAGRGLIPPESGGIPEQWPDELPDLCYELLVATNPDDGGRLDLTPDPIKDPEAAERFKAINDGIVDRIEIDQLILRVEQNSLNVDLPPIEVQAADDLNAQASDRRAWRTLGTIGGKDIPAGCGVNTGSPREKALGAGELGDLELNWQRSGESFLDNQLADEECLERQSAGGGVSSALACKELAVRARTRLVLDTAVNDRKPHGTLRLRMILVATFYVMPL